MAQNVRSLFFFVIHSKFVVKPLCVFTFANSDSHLPSPPSSSHAAKHLARFLLFLFMDYNYLKMLPHWPPWPYYDCQSFWFDYSATTTTTIYRMLTYYVPGTGPTIFLI